MSDWVVVPTYNEAENVGRFAAAVLAAAPQVQLLFVDDSSPDGTGDIVAGLARRERRVHLLSRPTKDGLGRAYVAAFGHALAAGAGRIVQMDCDFSHDPADVPRLLAALDGGADVAIGSRYVSGGSTPGWPWRRRLISRAGGIFVRMVTGMDVRDPTGGFKAWTAGALAAVGLTRVQSAGYSFQLETNYRAWRAKLKIVELPIRFTDRTAGVSKISAGIALESLKMAIKLRLST